MPRPALLIDVDGPLNPYQAKPTRRPVGYQTFRYPADRERRSLRVWLNPDHGPAFLGLADRFDLWWATSWEQDANTWVAPRVGLPDDLPVIGFTRTPPRPVPELDPGRGIYWKTEAIAQALAGRFFVWIDDDVTTADSDYLALRHSPGSVIYRIDPAVGLLPGDFDAIAALADGTVTGLVDGPTRQDVGRRRAEAKRKSRALAATSTVGGE